MTLPDRVEAARMNKWRDVLERLMIAEFALDSQGDRSGRRVNMSVEKLAAALAAADACEAERSMKAEVTKLRDEMAEKCQGGVPVEGGNVLGRYRRWEGMRDAYDIVLRSLREAERNPNTPDEQVGWISGWGEFEYFNKNDNERRLLAEGWRRVFARPVSSEDVHREADDGN